MPDRVNLKIRMEDRALWATVERFPGVFAMGDTLEELRVSLEEAIAFWVTNPGEDVRPVRLPPLEPAETVACAELAFAPACAGLDEQPGPSDGLVRRADQSGNSIGRPSVDRLRNRRS